MATADARTYLRGLVGELNAQWPANRTIDVVCHGHSVPAGYFATPMVDTFNAYPHLLHQGLKHRFPYAVVNVVVTAIGGENSQNGAERFEHDVLCHRPDVLTIDYGLNDRGIGLAAAARSWRSMIEQALRTQSKLLLLTPTPDVSGLADPSEEQWVLLQRHADQIRGLADEYQVGLVDSLGTFESYVRGGGDLTDLLSWTNHPNRKGHELVAALLMRWFAIL